MQTSDIANIVVDAIKTKKVVQQKEIASELALDKGTVSRMIYSEGKEGRLRDWMRILDMCGIELSIAPKKENQNASAKPKKMKPLTIPTPLKLNDMLSKIISSIET